MYKDNQIKEILIKFDIKKHMIIDCINCKKKFEIDSTLIPQKGRLIQCGSCNHTWFFIPDNKEISSIIDTKKPKNTKFKDKKAINQISKIDEDIINSENKINQHIKLGKDKKSFNFGYYVRTIFSSIIVLFISLVALIIILDTFKQPLSLFVPNLELYLFNLSEVFIDIRLFIKDLI